MFGLKNLKRNNYYICKNRFITNTNVDILFGDSTLLLPNILKTRIEQELDPYIVEWFEAGRGVTLLFIHIKQTEWENSLDTRERIKL